MTATIALTGLAILLMACAGNEPSPSGDADLTSTTVPATTAPSGEELPTLRRLRVEYQPGVYLELVEADECAAGLRPVMVSLSSRFADAFAARGYLGIVVEARVPPYEPRFDAQLVHAVGWAVHDMAIAVQWLRLHADEYCIEPRAIAASGYSFDALAALALAYSEDEAPHTELTIKEYGATITVEPVDRGPVPSELVPFSNDVNAVVSFAGFALSEDIDNGEPPVILFHAPNDTVVPFSLAEQTCAAAHAAGVTCELVTLPDEHAIPLDLSTLIDRAIRFLETAMPATPTG